MKDLASFARATLFKSPEHAPPVIGKAYLVIFDKGGRQLSDDFALATYKKSGWHVLWPDSIVRFHRPVLVYLELPINELRAWLSEILSGKTAGKLEEVES
ncbi:MAG: hypothetical protein AAF267_19175 [Deinococcota bacterium]